MANAKSNNRDQQVAGETNIFFRHFTGCGYVSGGKCDCADKPRRTDGAYGRRVWDRVSKKRAIVWAPTLSACRDAGTIKEGKVLGGERIMTNVAKLADAWAAWLEGAEAGRIRNNQRKVYRPSVLRGYEGSMTNHVLPTFGGYAVNAITRLELKRGLVERMQGEGMTGSTIGNALCPLRAFYRWAMDEEMCTSTPTAGLVVPADDEKPRDRVAMVPELTKLLAAAPEDDRAAWALAALAGMRRGEVAAIRVEDIDLDERVIHVSRSFDPAPMKGKVYEGVLGRPPTGSGAFVLPKTGAGIRDIGIPHELDTHLRAHLARTGRIKGLLFGRDGLTPMYLPHFQERSDKVWLKAGTPRFTLHELRHTYDSYLIAAGLDVKVASAWMGHKMGNISIDRYAHVQRDQFVAALAKLDAYLAEAAKRVQAA